MITIDTHHWNWAQWTLIVWLLLGVLSSGVLHGKPMVNAQKEPLTYNFAATLAKTILGFTILIFGGFFGSHQ